MRVSREMKSSYRDGSMTSAGKQVNTPKVTLLSAGAALCDCAAAYRPLYSITLHGHRWSWRPTAFHVRCSSRLPQGFSAVDVAKKNKVVTMDWARSMKSKSVLLPAVDLQPCMRYRRLTKISNAKYESNTEMTVS